MDSTSGFWKALSEGDEAGVRGHLERSPSLSAERDPKGISAPLFALYHRHRAVAELLAARKEGQQPLDVFEAAAFGRVDRLRDLLASDPSAVDAVSPADGFFPLGLAAFFGYEEAVQLLLDRGADVNLAARNPMKVRAIHAAAAARSFPIARRLVERGADVNARQQAGFAPLHEAALSGQLDLAGLLLAQGADPNARADDGKTPLELARSSGNRAMTELLELKGARDPLLSRPAHENGP